MTKKPAPKKPAPKNKPPRKAKKAAPARRSVSGNTLNGREKSFVAHYVKDPNGTKAATAAGYSAKTAAAAASRLLKIVKVKNAIEKGRDRIAAKLGISAEMIAQEYWDIAKGSIGDYVRIDDEGQPIVDLSDIDDHQMGLISEISSEIVSRTTSSEGEGEAKRTVISETRKTRVKPYSRIDGLNGVVRVLGLGSTKHEVVGADGKPLIPEQKEISSHDLAVAVTVALQKKIELERS